MIDVKLIRNNPEIVRSNLERRTNRGNLQLLEEFVEADRTWRSLQTEVNEWRRRRNEISLKISGAKERGLDACRLLDEAVSIQEKVKSLNVKVEESSRKARELLMRIPNLIHESVPFGEDESDNVEIRRWGSSPMFDFEPMNHLEVALNLGLIDEERANKVAGTGFYYLKDDLVLLDLALQRFAVEFMMNRGYTLVEPPYMLRRRPYEGVTDLSDFETVMYKIEKEDSYLIATSEHPMAAMFMNETLNQEDLPIRLVGISTNFRKEIGSHGKYTKGLFRMHQFNKIEQFIFSLPEESWSLHEELQWNCERLYQKLGLHYRVVDVCTGDIGTVAARKYDTETWMADGNFREVGSNSNCTDYQARRLNVKYREGPGKPPRGFVHTLNSTALATSRTMLTILEQYQQRDGSVMVPVALRPYMNGVQVLRKT